MRETEKKLLELAEKHKELYQEAAREIVREIKEECTTYDEAIKELKSGKAMRIAKTSEEKNFIYQVTEEVVRKLYEEAYRQNMKSEVKENA